MKTPKLLKGIAGKFKNKKGSQIAAITDDIEDSRIHDVPEGVEVKEQINADKATEIDTQLCENINKDSEDLNTSKKAQNNPTETPNTHKGLSLTEIKQCDTVDEKSSTKTTQQRQAILAGFVGTTLLVGSVALCIMEMHVIAVVGGIFGLICMGFALYNLLKPNTKLEKIEDVDQPNVQSFLNSI